MKAQQERNSSPSETVVENAPELTPQTIPRLSEFPIISGTLKNPKFNTPRNPLSKTSSSSSSNSSSFSIYETFSEKIENLTATSDVLVFFSLTSRFIILIFMWYL